MTTTIASQNRSGITTYAWTGAANDSASTMTVDGVLQRTNRANDPAATASNTRSTTLAWNPQWYGNGGTGVTTYVNGQNDGPAGTTTYIRKTWSTAPATAGDIGFVHNSAASNAGSVAGFPVSPGQVITFSEWIRNNTRATLQVSLQLFWRDASNNYLSVSAGDVVNLPAKGNTWTRITGTFTVPASAVTVGAKPLVNFASGSLPTTPDTLDGGALLVEFAAAPATYFDGNTPNVETYPTIIPDLIVGYEASRPTKNVLHQVLGNRSSTVTVNGSGLRTGTMTLLFASEVQKTMAVAVLASVAFFWLSSTDLDSIDMMFVIAGDIVETLDPETLSVWTVAFGWEEIA